jgi:hypothetical protein
MLSGVILREDKRIYSGRFSGCAAAGQSRLISLVLRKVAIYRYATLFAWEHTLASSPSAFSVAPRSSSSCSSFTGLLVCLPNHLTYTSSVTRLVHQFTGCTWFTCCANQINFLCRLPCAPVYLAVLTRRGHTCAICFYGRYETLTLWVLNPMAQLLTAPSSMTESNTAVPNRS